VRMTRFGALLVESLVFLTRVNAEVYANQGFRVLARCSAPVFVVAACLTSASPFTDDEAAVAVLRTLPTVAIVVQLAATEFWEYAAVVVVLTFVQGRFLHEALVLCVSVVVRAHRVDRRSALLHVVYTVCAAAALLLPHDDELRPVLTILTLELSSWASERHLLPWTVPTQQIGCVQNIFLFLCSMVSGVHFIDAAQEAERMFWRPGRYNLIAGVAVYGDRAYIRYRGNVVGCLLAYLEGLSILPVRLTPCDADPNTTSFCVSLFFLENVSVLHLDAWVRREERVLVCAPGRFPYRRVLQGLILRM
jgi:hypothetical protein